MRYELEVMHTPYAIVLCVGALSFTVSVEGLKCRNAETSGQDQDMEWAVRQCVRQLLYNASEFQPDGHQNKQDGGGSGIFSSLRDWERPRRDHRDAERGKVPQNRFRGGPSTEAGGPRGGPYRDEAQRGAPGPIWQGGRFHNGKPDRNEEPENAEDESFGLPPPDRKRQRPRQGPPPHTPGQQNQFDRDVIYNKYNRRPMFHPNNNHNDPGNSDWGESRLGSIDPCMIHCIFQELQMFDQWGRLSKTAVIDRMTRRLRDRELREFLQFTIEECFNEIDRGEDRDQQGKYGDRPDSCRSTKILAICLEDRGRQACEDWEDPMNSDDKNDKRNENNNNNREREKNKEGKKGILNSNRG